MREPAGCLASLRSLGSLAPPPGVHNLEAVHTVTLFFTTLGMLPATWFAIAVYSDSNVTYVDGSVLTGERWTAYTPVTHLANHYGILEPFAAVSNTATFCGGLGLFLMPFLSGDFMPAPTFAVAAYMALLGASSWVFHADGSKMDTWQHAADRLSMFILFAYMSVACFSGLWHACRGQRATPRSPIILLTNVGGISFAMYCVVYQRTIQAFQFLVQTGFVLFTCSYLTMATLHYHRQSATAPRRRDLHKLLLASLRAAPSTAIKMLALGVAYFIRTAADEEGLDLALAPFGNDTGTFEERVEWRRLHDVEHGTWHFWTSYAIMAAGLTLVEGLSGELTPPAGYVAAPSFAADEQAATRRWLSDWFESEHPAEVVSMLWTCVLLVWTAALEAVEVSSTTWLLSWALIVALTLPLAASMLAWLVRRHNRRLAKLRAAEPSPSADAAESESSAGLSLKADLQA